MKKTLSFLVIVLLALGCVQPKGEVDVVCPNAIQQAWADTEIGVLIHFDMPVYQNEYDFRQWGSHPDASVFNPTDLDTDQWLETASKLGAKYAVLVAKHCSGFSLWPTDAHAYSVKNTPWRDGKGDIVKDFVASCKKYNIKPGIYASTSANGYLHVDNPGVVQEGSPVSQEEYNKIVIQQLTELWSNYGELFEIWFDGGVLSPQRGGADVLSLVQKLQPNAVAFQGPYGHPNLVRWVGNEEGVAPYPCWATADSTTNADGTQVVEGLNGNPDGLFWCPGESDFTLRWNHSFQGGWFWKAGQDNMMFTVDELMTKYITSVGRNTNMLLGIVVDDSGLIPDADVERITEFGEAIKQHFSTPLQAVSGEGLEYVIPFQEPTAIDRVIIQEDIAFGERVLEYQLSGYADGKWTTLAQGSNIGHKHIDVFAKQALEKIKLTVIQSKATPKIKNFAVFEAPHELLLCGDNKVWIIDKEKSGGEHVDILWQWANTDVQGQAPDVYQKYLQTMDECKFVDHQTKLLLTASSGGVVLVDRATKKCLFYAYAPMAHSADLLPGNKIAVALSTHPKGNSIEIYDINQPEVVLFKDSLYSGHGSVWMEKRNRYYALGYDQLREYSLVDWDSSSPRLKLERSWTIPSEGGHELMPVSDDELLVSDHHGVSIFHIGEEQFHPFAPLDTAHDIKSANYNKSTNELIYTQAEISWWTHNIYLKNPDKVITIPDIKLYKVRASD